MKNRFVLPVSPVALAVVIAVLLSASALLLQQRTTYAAFHCIRIHAVMAGFNGNNTIQYVELRMSADLQNVLSGHKIRFYDASGTLKATFTFPTDVPLDDNGDSILVATQEFNNNSVDQDADFTFTGNTVDGSNANVPYPVQSPGGKVVFADEPGDFNCNINASLPVDSVAYGGASATFGSPAPALPSPSNNQVLRLNNLNTKPSNNSTEYSLQPVSSVAPFSVAVGSLKTNVSTPRNNSRRVLRLSLAVGGVAELPDVDSTAPLAQPDSSDSNAGVMAAIAAGAAAVLGALGGAVVYARRRWLR